MRPPILLDDTTFNDRLSRLITTQGDAERAGITLEEVADMIFTRRTNIGAVVSEPKVKAPKGAKTKITGQAMDDLLG